MKTIKQYIVIMIALVFVVSMVPVKKSEAAVVGLGTGIIGLTIGGVACLAAVPAAIGAASASNCRNGEIFWGAMAVILWVTGVTLDKEGAVIGKETAAFNLGQDLSQKVEAGIYTQEEADNILSDYTEKWGKAEPKDIFIDTNGKKSQDILKEFMEETNLSELTSAYFLSIQGIQVN